MATLYSVRTGSTTLTASSTKSLILLNPVARGIRLTRLGVAFDASTSSAGVGLELYIVTAIGTPAGTTGTINKYGDPAAANADTTALTILTTEPTTVVAYEDWFVQPFGGTLVVDFPLGRELTTGAAGNRIGIRYTSGTATPNCRAYMVWEQQ